MYSQPQVYGEKPFDAAYLPRCMYPMKPYYETEGPASSASSASKPETNNNITMASILPLPLLPTDMDLNDGNIKHTLEDVLSRQMLLLCRLNQLEQQLLAQQQQVEVSSPAPPKSLSLAPGATEDIVIHFNLDSVPYSLFALASVLRKSTPVLVNLHLHNSVASSPSVIKRVAELRARLTGSIGFQFSTSEQYLSRSQFPVIITFIVTSATVAPKTTFKAGQTVVEGELPIARQLVSLLQADVNGSESVWSLLTNPATLSSDKALLEQLGPRVFNLSESSFLAEQSVPSLLDAVVWSLTVPEFTRPGGLVASSLRNSQLLNAKWQASVRQFVSSA